MKNKEKLHAQTGIHRGLRCSVGKPKGSAFAPGFGVAAMLLALVAGVFACQSFSAGAPAEGGMLLGSSLLLGRIDGRTLLRQEANDWGAMDAPGFQAKAGELMGGIADRQEEQAKALEEGKSREEKLLSEIDRLDGDTKKALEGLDASVKQFDGLSASVTKFDQSMAKLRLQLEREKRAMGGDPIKRITGDEAKAAVLLDQVYKAIQKSDQLPAQVRTTLGEDTTPGSTMIDDELSADIYDALEEYGDFRSLGLINMGTKATKISLKTARAEAKFVLTEGGTIPEDTRKAGSQATLTAELMAGIIPVSMQLIEDGEFDVVATEVIPDALQALAELLDTAAFVGDGTEDAANGGITGLFEGGTAATATTTRTTIAATKYDDWLKCLTAVDSVVLKRQSKWWIHPTLLAAALAVKDDNGRPIFQTAMDAPAFGSVGSILGFPVQMVSAAPSTDGAAAKVAAFGDPRAYAVGLRSDFKVESSDHANWNEYERSFRFTGRADAVERDASALAVFSTAAT